MRKMMPIGPLMMEHRLIERMIRVMAKELERIEALREVNPTFIDTLVDFIRTYADRCHHGKEEDILFRELNRKPLSDEHKKMMNELIEEHKLGRATTAKLVEANRRYVKGEHRALSTMTECMSLLVDFYPKHIEKEDKHFFLPVMGYFSQEEKDSLLEEGFAFDQNLIHQKYRIIAEQSEGFYK